MSNSPQVLFNKAAKHFQANEYKQAAIILNSMVNLKIISPDVLNLLASSIFRLGDIRNAESLFSESVKLDSGYAQTYVHMAAYFRALGELDQSIHHYLKSYELDGNEVQSLLNAGLLLQEQEKWTESEEIFDRYLAVTGETFEGLLGKAVARSALFDYETGEEIFKKLLRERPDDKIIKLNLAMLYTKSKRHAKADKLFRDLVGDGFRQAEFAFSLHLLSSGNWVEGFKYFEARQVVNELRDFCAYHKLNQWDGRSSLKGLDVFVQSEQGLGDHIRYLYFLKLLAEEAATVTIICDPRLFPIINYLYPSFVCIERDALTVDELSNYKDYVFLCMGSLGKIYGETLGERANSHSLARSDASFISVDPSWRYIPRERSDKPLVGLCWRSIKYNVNRNDWYCSAEEFAKTLQGIDANFVNLQYGATQEELDAFAHTGLSLIEPENIDLKDDQFELADLMNGLDAVVGVSTALTELAGAVAVPTYVLAISDIRWFMSDKHIRGFYPKTQVFYKERLTDWGDTLKTLSSALTRDLARSEEKV